MKSLLYIFTFFFCLSANAQNSPKDIREILGATKFKTKFDKTIGDIVSYPVVTKPLKKLVGKKIRLVGSFDKELKGYFKVYDENQSDLDYNQGYLLRCFLELPTNLDYEQLFTVEGIFYINTKPLEDYFQLQEAKIVE